jgi:hypothetical protein
MPRETITITITHTAGGKVNARSLKLALSPGDDLSIEAGRLIAHAMEGIVPSPISAASATVLEIPDAAVDTEPKAVYWACHDELVPAADSLLEQRATWMKQSKASD